MWSSFIPHWNFPNFSSQLPELAPVCWGQVLNLDLQGWLDHAITEYPEHHWSNSWGLPGHPNNPTLSLRTLSKPSWISGSPKGCDHSLGSCPSAWHPLKKNIFLISNPILPAMVLSLFNVSIPTSGRVFWALYPFYSPSSNPHQYFHRSLAWQQRSCTKLRFHGPADRKFLTQALSIQAEVAITTLGSVEDTYPQ